jgi:hypothetical protein
MSKMPFKENMSRYGRRVGMKQTGKMSQKGHFYTIQVRMYGNLVTVILHPLMR